MVRKFWGYREGYRPPLTAQFQEALLQTIDSWGLSDQFQGARPDKFGRWNYTPVSERVLELLGV